MKQRPVPTIYFAEKIEILNRQFDRLVLQGQDELDQSNALAEIDALARVIGEEAQKWTSVLNTEALRRVDLERDESA